MQAAAAMWTETPEDVEDTSLWVGTPAFTEAVNRKRVELDAEVPASARSAVQWAAGAGFAADVAAASIEELLRSGSVFVEELFSEFLDALGFPEPLGDG